MSGLIESSNVACDGSFSYQFYDQLLQDFSQNRYTSIDYFCNEPSTPRSLLLRHDIDINVFGALSMVEVEQKYNYISTWFLQPNNDFYNMLSTQCLSIFRQLNDAGCILGLHIDPSLASDLDELADMVACMHQFYSRYIPLSRVFSFHRPAKFLTDFDITIEGFTNAYNSVFFKKMVYVSDSKRREFWLEPRLNLAMEEGNPICLLTHPLWWSDEEQTEAGVAQRMECLAMERIARFSLKNNITNFQNIY
jgi:hypothetical protein